MELKEMIKVMQHYADGGEVEIRLKDDDNDTWEKPNRTSWNWGEYDYRIKEQKQKVTIEKWLCKDREDNYIVIEGSNVVLFRFEKIKLLETYEVEKELFNMLQQKAMIL